MERGFLCARIPESCACANQSSAAGVRPITRSFLGKWKLLSHPTKCAFHCFLRCCDRSSINSGTSLELFEWKYVSGSNPIMAQQQVRLCVTLRPECEPDRAFSSNMRLEVITAGETRFPTSRPSLPILTRIRRIEMQSLRNSTSWTTSKCRVPMI